VKAEIKPGSIGALIIECAFLEYFGLIEDGAENFTRETRRSCAPVCVSD
jgi:hypothetical protein